MSKFVVHDDVIFNTRTGSVTGINHSNDKHFGVVVMYGHCDKKYFIPIFYSLHAENKEAAIAMAKNLGGVKVHPNNILAFGEINELQYTLIRYCNDRDKFLNQIASYDEIEKRQVVLPECVNYETKHIEKYEDKIPAYMVKTAEKYGEKWSLQRLFAPTKVGTKLVYPKYVDINTIMDNYFYQMVKLYGKYLKKKAPLAFYYELYGENNPLDIKYNNGVFSYNDNNGNLVEVEAPENMIEFLNKHKEQFLKEDEKKKKEVKLPEVTIPSARDKFNAKYKKYQDVKNKKLPTK